MDQEQVLTNTADVNQSAPLPIDPPQEVVEEQEQPDEALALERGWVPKEKWRDDGRGTAWVDANEYNDRYERVMPLVRRENKTLHGTLSQQAQTIAEMQARLDAMERANQETAASRAEVRIQMLEQERANALAAGDSVEFTRLDRELRRAERESGGAAPVRPATPPNTPAQPANGVAPAQVQAAINDFTSRYPIFNTDAALQRELGVEVQQLQNVARAAGQQVDPAEILEQAANRVRRNNPQAFPNPRTRAPMAEGRGAPARSNTGQRTWNDLTAESQETFNGMLARNKSLTREKLLASAPDEVFKR